MNVNIIPAALARRRNYVGPALFAYGFRPFFLAGSAWATFGIALWLPVYLGEIAFPTALRRPTGTCTRCSTATCRP